MPSFHNAVSSGLHSARGRLFYWVLHNIVTFLKSYATLRLWETRQGYGVIFKS